MVRGKLFEYALSVRKGSSSLRYSSRMELSTWVQKRVLYLSMELFLLSLGLSKTILWVPLMGKSTVRTARVSSKLGGHQGIGQNRVLLLYQNWIDPHSGPKFRGVCACRAIFAPAMDPRSLETEGLGGELRQRGNTKWRARPINLTFR